MTTGEYGHERLDDDAYFTPEWCTKALLKHFSFRHEILEPACGNGAISKVLTAAHYEVTSQDIKNYGFSNTLHNFLGGPPISIKQDIITNPPYSCVESFVRRALAITREHEGAVAMLMRHDWDCASSRTHLFNHPFTAKLTLTKRPRWIVGTTVSPRFNYSWYIWDWKNMQTPRCYWGQ